MMNLIKRIVNGAYWRMCSLYHWIFPHKVLDITDRAGKESGNIVEVEGALAGGKLRIVFRGKYNKVVIGPGCNLYRKNAIFIEGANNIVKIGGNTTFDENVMLVAGEGTEIKIGDDCQFAANVTIRTTDQHPIYDAEGRRVNPAKNINIDEHVWLGAHTVVMKGVAIGKGTVVGYGSIVTKSLPEDCVAVGSPARVVNENIEWCRTFKKA